MKLYYTTQDLSIHVIQFQIINSILSIFNSKDFIFNSIVYIFYAISIFPFHSWFSTFPVRPNLKPEIVFNSLFSD
jgi:hypothetical protein